jgi:hypothetical protein
METYWIPGVNNLGAYGRWVLAEARALKNSQENLEGNRQALTQQLKATVERGREAARKLQAFAKIRLGTKSEHLRQFGVAPIRKRPRKLKPTEVKPASATVQE